MQSWEKHQVDLYLLATDILDNHYYQPQSYKGQFYYAFNGSLGLLQSRGTYSDQLKLLDQLVGLGALTYTIKTPPDGLAKEFFGKNALDAPRDALILLKINPEAFNKIYKGLEKYRPAELELLTQGDLTVFLVLDNTDLVIRANQRPGQYAVGSVRQGGIPQDIFSYLINKSPNVVVTRTMLETDAGIKTSRKLNQVVNKALMPLARNVFAPERYENSVKLVNPAVIADSTLEAIIATKGPGASQSISH